jgi:hypothetical protein
MYSINSEIEELQERISILQKEKYRLGLLQQTNDGEELGDKYSNLSVDLEYAEQSSNVDQYALTIEGTLNISYEYEKSPVNISVTYSSWATRETLGDGPVINFDINITGDANSFAETLQSAFETPEDWKYLMIDLNDL